MGDARDRVAVEAGVTCSWWKYVGLDGDVVGIDRFGVSGPGNIGVGALDALGPFCLPPPPGGGLDVKVPVGVLLPLGHVCAPSP